MEDDDDPYGEADLAWDDAALQELESFEVNSLAQHRATQAPPPPPPRASQVPPQKPRTPAVQRPPAQHQQQQRRFPAPAPAPPRAAAGPPPTQSLPQPTQQPQYGHAKPSGILRPARPPPRPNAASTSSSASASNATAATKSAAGGGGGGGWKPRQSLNERGEPGFVDPNPFASASTRRAHPAVVDEDEDLPAIEVSEEGYRAEPQRGTTVSVPPPCAGAGREPGGGKVQPGRGGMLASERGSEEGQRAVVERGLDEAGKKEVEALRTEKEKLAQQLQLALDAQEKLKLEVMTKAGENSLVRQRLTKAEAAHTAAMRAEQRDKALLSEQLEAKEREYRAAFERMKMEDAFRRQELATAASASSAAGTSGSATSQRHYHHPHHAGLSSAKSQRFYARAQSAAPSAQASPSAGRAARAASQQPPAPAKKPPGPSFAGFQNAFGPSAAAPAGVAGKSARAKGKERERDEGQVEKRGAAADEPEGSMGPPVRGKREAPRTPAAGPRAKRRRGEEREDERDSGRASRSLLLVEEEGEEGDLGGHEHINVQDGTGGPDPVAEENDDDGEDAWVWVAEQHDTRSELLAAVFTHTTLVNIDLEPAAVPPTAHPHSHHRSPLAAAGSTLAGAGTARAGTARHGTLGATFGTRTSAAATHAPTPAAPSGPVPTFHALMNLRFPPSTPPALVAEHESIARELFTLLGRRFDPHSLSQPATSALASLPPSLALLTSSSPEELETALLAYGLARSFAALLAVLDAATLVGPMTALMRLIAHLTFIFPPFAHACCVVSTKPTPNATSSKPSTAGSAQSEVPLLSLLGRIIARYGRPEPPSKDPAGPSSSSSSLHGRTTPTTASGPGSRTLLRSRKARVARPSGGGRKRRVGEKDGGAAEEEEARVPLESGKRAKLLEALLAVLEGVGWSFLGLLKSPNAIATLLDPNHPIGTLLASTRVLAILACRPALFRTLLGTKFYEAPDVRASKLPLVDRIATLLVVPRTDSPSTHTLDQTLLTLSSLLLTSHEDAIMLVAQSATFVPELLAKMWRDVRTLWDWDGRDVGPHGLTREVLNRTTARLSSLLHVFYYLSLAPHSSLTIADLLAGPSSVSASIAADGTSVAPPAVKDAPAYQRQAVNDLFMAALGTVAFATLGADADEDGPGGGGGGGEGGEGPAEPQEESGMPSWAERGSKERRMLCELGYLAQEILEDVSPLELEEVEVCFGPIDLASGGGGGGDGGADGSGGEGDDDAMRDSGAGADEEEAQAQGEVDEEGEREARAALDREEEGEGASS
ncbi:hypothetical protein Rhopal_006698-T1 [Rhodotorula paludigena]|uniref:Proteophosphoglycan ppg4 n=1 Tax=Rhodotorula paludigena TaxID=86838 RepID=A0AAV5GVX0_9BASI|nr:hypothetical protein Rhopal_006698-T1 [Rhodotorula paludigena]